MALPAAGPGTSVALIGSGICWAPARPPVAPQISKTITEQSSSGRREVCKCMAFKNGIESIRLSYQAKSHQESRRKPRRPCSKVADRTAIVVKGWKKSLSVLADLWLRFYRKQKDNGKRTPCFSRVRTQFLTIRPAGRSPPPFLRDCNLCNPGSPNSAFVN